MRRGFKISLEGIDGAGKTTQLRHVVSHLQDSGFKPMIKPCRNNTNSDELDGRLLSIIKRDEEMRRYPITDALASAARTLYVDEKIINPHLEKGGVVVADRDIDTAIAYSLPDLQKSYPEVDIDLYVTWMLGVYSVRHAMPDLTIYLDIAPERALSRALNDDIPNERIIFNDQDLVFMQSVQQGYSRLIERSPDRIYPIDVNDKSIDEVSEEISHHINRFINRRDLP